MSRNDVLFLGFIIFMMVPTFVGMELVEKTGDERFLIISLASSFIQIVTVIVYYPKRNNKELR